MILLPATTVPDNVIYPLYVVVFAAESNSNNVKVLVAAAVAFEPANIQ